MSRQEERRERTEEQERKDRNGTAKNKRPRTKEQELRQRPEEQEQKDPHRKIRAAQKNRRTRPKNKRGAHKNKRQGERKAKTRRPPRQRQAHYPTKGTHPGAWQLPQTKQQTKQQNKPQTLLLPPQLHSALRASLRCDVNYPALSRAGYTLILFLLSPTLPLPPLGGVGGEDKVTDKTKTMNLNISPPCLPQLVNKKKKKYIRKQHDNKTTHELQANLRADHGHS